MEKNTATDTRPRLLYVSPTYPDTQGNGLAMRAAMFIEALSTAYGVSLLVVPLFGGATATSRRFIDEHCDQLIEVPPEGKAGWQERRRRHLERLPAFARIMANQAQAARSALGGERFDVVHAFRTYSAPLALAIARDAESTPTLWLDVDDIESGTHARLAALYRLNGRFGDAETSDNEARRFQALEQEILPRFQRIYVCSPGDALWVSRHTQAEVRVAPNAVRLPQTPLLPLTTHPFTFLFVGTMGYYPNQDAVTYFCQEVLPLIRARTQEPFRVRIAGKGLPPSLHALAHTGPVRLVGEVADIEREYADAEAVIVPIRAGGGMRIKVLEAFAYRRPVIAASVGVEGIEATPGEHYLLGDRAGAFAQHCLRLMADRDLSQRLAGNAYDLVASRYTPEAVRPAIIAPS